MKKILLPILILLSFFAKAQYPITMQFQGPIPGISNIDSIGYTYTGGFPGIKYLYNAKKTRQVILSYVTTTYFSNQFINAGDVLHPISLRDSIPTQAGNSGKVLGTNGTSLAWVVSGGRTTTNLLTINNSGSGTASPFTFDGSVAKTISYNSIGAQPTLISGTNIKTINSTSLLGSGNINVSPALTFDNGLNITGTTVELGGAIIQDTNIGISGYQFSIASPSIRFQLDDFNKNLILNVQTTGTTSSDYYTGIASSVNNSLTDPATSGLFTGTALLYARYTGGSSELLITPSAMTIYDQINSTGLQEAVDYSANYTARNYITKGYADANYTTGSSSSFIKNQTSQQASSNFNISGTGIAGVKYVVQKTAVNTPSYLINDGSGNELARIVSDNNTNFFAGYQAGLNNIGTSTSSGEQNTFIGSGSGKLNTTGYNNTFNGYNAGYNNTITSGGPYSGGFEGQDNVYLGAYAAYSNTYGFNQIAIGSHALYNATGYQNIAIGKDALYSAVGAGGFYNNVAIGIQSMFSNTTGHQNMSIGFQSLYTNTTGNDNIGIGNLSLRTNTTGSFNFGLGTGALQSNTTGFYNIAFSSLVNSTTGSYNLGIGVGSLLSNTTGSNNIALGAYINNVSATLNGQLNIGNVLYGTNLYQGTSNSSTPTTTGSIGIGVTTLTARLHLPAGTATANTAPLKINSGTNLTTPEDGAVEYNGTHFYATIGSTRYQLDQQSGGGSSGTVTNVATGYGISGGPITTTGTLTADTASSTGLVSKTRLATNLTGYVPYTGAIGNVNLGTNFVAAGASLTPLTAIHAISTLSTSPRGILSDQNSADVVGARITMRKSRGTPASPTIITTGDALGSWTAAGYTNAYTDAAKVLVTSTGTISNGIVPAIMELQTMNASGTLTDGIKIDQAQTLTFGAYGTGLLHSGSSGAVTSSLLVNADITAGTITNASLANSTISGVALGGTLAALTATNSTLAFSGSYTGAASQTIGLNLSNANTWVGIQTLPTPVFTGLPTGSGVASAATASTLMSRDANANTAINNLMQGYTTTVTAVGTTTLTVASTYLQYFTGTTTQTVLLPVASTLVLGTQYQIDNQSTGNVTIQSSGANNIIVLAGGNSINVTCILTTGTTAVSWQVNALGNGTITGTGSTVFSASPTFTGTMLAANVSLSGVLAAGGTGSSSSFSTAGSGVIYGQTSSAAYQFAGSTNVQYRNGFYGNTLTNVISANASFANAIFASTGAQTNTSGTSAMLVNVSFNAPAFVLGTGSTTTNAYNIYVNGNASTSGTGTLTNAAGALWINGNTRLDLGSDATGDIFYRSASNGGQMARLPIGSTGQVLGVASGVPAYVNGPAYATTTAGDANTTIANAYVFETLPVVTANRTLSIPSASTYSGQPIIIDNINTSGTFTWSFTGATVKDAAGNTLTTLSNGIVYHLISNGTNFIKIN